MKLYPVVLLIWMSVFLTAGCQNVDKANESPEGEKITFEESMKRPPEQGTIITCEICMVLYPERYEENPDTCPACHGAKEHFQPARMMSNNMAIQEAKILELRVRGYYQKIHFEDDQIDGSSDMVEKIRALQHQRLIHALIYDESAVEAIAEEIHAFDKKLGYPME